MLYLTRKVGESVVINDDIEVTVVEVRGRSIKLGFTFPNSVSVLRREIFDRIQEENRAAAEAGQAVSGPLPQVSTTGITEGQSPGGDSAVSDRAPVGEQQPGSGVDAEDVTGRGALRMRSAGGRRQD